MNFPAAHGMLADGKDIIWAASKALRKRNGD
jgi:hypothetical protein